MAKKQAKKKHPGGRPEKHTRDEILGWADEFYKACSTGMSLKAFLGLKGLHRNYFAERQQRDIPELSSILEKGKALQEEFYRKLIIAGSSGQIKGFQLGGFIWLTKHMLGWWDVVPNQEIDLSLGQGKSTKVVFSTSWGSSVEPSDKDTG